MIMLKNKIKILKKEKVIGKITSLNLWKNSEPKNICIFGEYCNSSNKTKNWNKSDKKYKCLSVFMDACMALGCVVFSKI
jgi:hypothetical protein